MPTNNFDALLADLDQGGMDLPEDADEAGQAGFQKAMAFDSILSGMDDATASISSIRFPKLTKAQAREILRHQIREVDQKLAKALANGAIEKGEMTGEEAVRHQARLHRLGEAVDRDEAAGDGKGGPGPLPPEMNPGAFRAKVQAAMHAGRIRPDEAVVCEAHLLRGTPPPKDIFDRVMAA